MSKSTWAQIVGKAPASFPSPISKHQARSKNTVPSKPLLNTSENLPAVCWGTPEELDPQNTRLFAKGLPPELFNISLLFRSFRPYGQIRSLAVNTKRANAIIEFEKKESALSAKLNCIHLYSESGVAFPAKLFWGKHIERPPPLKFEPPNWAQQIDRIHQVHLSQRRKPRKPLHPKWVDRELGMLEQDADVWSKCGEPSPPGIPAADALESWFSHLNRDHHNVGYYPRRSQLDWFTHGKNQAPELPGPTYGSPAVTRPYNSDHNISSAQPSCISTPTQKEATSLPHSRPNSFVISSEPFGSKAPVPSLELPLPGGQASLESRRVITTPTTSP